MHRTAMTGLVLSLALASGASADVLWDQSAIDFAAPFSVPNHVTSSAPIGGQREVYSFADITVPAGGWTINSVSVYMGFWALYVNGPATGAVLNIVPRTPGQPPSNAYNPRRPANGGSGTLVSVTTTQLSINSQTIDQVTAGGLNIVLAAGDYWISLTPTYGGGGFGQPNQWPTATPIGGNHYYRGANLATMDAAWTAGQGEGAMLITGVPTPGAAALFGVASLAAARRRRSN